METGLNLNKVQEFLGRRVRKHFEGHGYFVGEVISYNPSRKFFRVMYEDGDKEEVDVSELEEILWDSRTSKLKTKGNARIVGTKGKAAREIARQSGGGQNRVVMSEEEIKVHVEEPVRYRNLQGFDLNQPSEQMNELPFLTGNPSLQHSGLGTMGEGSLGGQTTRKNMKDMVGQTVRKFFQGHGYFLGTVVSYQSRSRYFVVQYIDGDVEELDWSELKEILIKNNETIDVSGSNGSSGLRDQAAETAVVSMKTTMVGRAAGIGTVRENDFKRAMEDEEVLKRSRLLTKLVTGTKAHEVSDKPEGRMEARKNHEAKKSMPKFRSPATGVRELEVKFGRGINSKKLLEETPGDGRFGRSYVRGELDLNIPGTNPLWAEDDRENGSTEDYVFTYEEKKRAAEAKQAQRYTDNVRQQELMQDGSSERFEFVGRTVRKHFQGFGDFTGKVVSYDAYSGYFKVEYSDGDREEVDLAELAEIIEGEQFAGQTVQKRNVLPTSKRK